MEFNVWEGLVPSQRIPAGISRMIWGGAVHVFGLSWISGQAWHCLPPNLTVTAHVQTRAVWAARVSEHTAHDLPASEAGAFSSAAERYASLAELVGNAAGLAAGVVENRIIGHTTRGCLPLFAHTENAVGLIRHG
jgi:hypothetical protein